MSRRKPDPELVELQRKLDRFSDRLVEITENINRTYTRTSRVQDDSEKLLDELTGRRTARQAVKASKQAYEPNVKTDFDSLQRATEQKRAGCAHSDRRYDWETQSVSCRQCGHLIYQDIQAVARSPRVVQETLKLLGEDDRTCRHTTVMFHWQWQKGPGGLVCCSCHKLVLGRGYCPVPSTRSNCDHMVMRWTDVHQRYECASNHYCSASVKPPAAVASMILSESTTVTTFTPEEMIDRCWAQARRKHPDLAEEDLAWYVDQMIKAVDMDAKPSYVVLAPQDTRKTKKGRQRRSPGAFRRLLFRMGTLNTFESSEGWGRREWAMFALTWGLWVYGPGFTLAGIVIAIWSAIFSK